MTRKYCTLVNGVRVGKRNTPTGVNVDSRVAVLRGVAVAVRVGTDAVRVDAALAVCTINVLSALESSVGTGATAAGTHAITSIKAMNQSKGFFVGDCIFIHSNQV